MLMLHAELLGSQHDLTLDQQEKPVIFRTFPSELVCESWFIWWCCFFSRDERHPRPGTKRPREDEEEEEDLNESNYDEVSVPIQAHHACVGRPLNRILKCRTEHVQRQPILNLTGVNKSMTHRS